MQSPAPQTHFRRHFYSKQQSFEQSLDVWKPVDVTEGKHGSLPIVVFVIGSGWVGHRSLIYSGTSWWNSSGPRTFARLGFVCVRIRHRGAFPKLPDPHVILSFIVAAAATALVHSGPTASFITTMLLAMIWGLVVLGGHGSAAFDEMLHDVTDALAWVHNNKDEHLTLLPGKSSTSSAPLVFGGYSSGAHVAATVLQRPDLLASRGLPPPEKVCDAVLMVSGVLAVRPPLQDKGVNPPRWFTDLVVHTVFGKTGALTLSSPLHGTPPRLPHVLIGCRKEAFGINLMDLFFCSCAFSKTLGMLGVPNRYVEVESDHWNILGSQALAQVLNNELEWITMGHEPATKFCSGGHAIALASHEDTRHE